MIAIVIITIIIIVVIALITLISVLIFIGIIAHALVNCLYQNLFLYWLIFIFNG